MINDRLTSLTNKNLFPALSNSDSISKLHLTALFANVEEVKNILNEEGKKEPDNKGRTPLHYLMCCKNANEDIVLEIANLLIANDYSLLDKTNDSCRTPIHYASVRGDKDLVDELLKKINTEEDWIKCRDITNRNPLFYVSQGSDDEASACIAKEFIKLDEKWKESRTLQDFYGQTPLHLAADDGNLSVLQVLLNDKYYKSNINVRDYDGITPLFFAEYDKKVSDLLKNYGAKESPNELEGIPNYDSIRPTDVLALLKGQNRIPKESKSPEPSNPTSCRQKEIRNLKPIECYNFILEEMAY